jgi:trehalose 6-phosphate phosphatase
VRDVLLPNDRRVLEQFAWSKVLLVFDYDGTLAPTGDDPDGAGMRPSTRELLARVALLYPVSVVSEREPEDVRRLLAGIGVASVVGNHGVDARVASSQLIAEVSRWRPTLERLVTILRGVVIEDKTTSVTVNYRQSREKKRAKAAIMAATSTLDGVRVIQGAQVVKILPTGAPHKGIALELERERLGCDTAVYVGCDTADEEVFALDQPGRLLTIRVGSRSTSAAAYYIADQLAIDALLRTLVELRGEVQAGSEPVVTTD